MIHVFPCTYVLYTTAGLEIFKVTTYQSHQMEKNLVEKNYKVAAESTLTSKLYLSTVLELMYLVTFHHWE